MLKDILQVGMIVELRNGAKCKVHNASNGLYIFGGSQKELIRIPEDYDDKLVCEQFYPFSIDRIYRNPKTISPDDAGYHIDLHLKEKKALWERNKTQVAVDVGVAQVLQQIDHVKNSIIESVFHNVKFNSEVFAYKLGEATAVLFESSHKVEDDTHG